MAFGWPFAGMLGVRRSTEQFDYEIVKQIFLGVSSDSRLLARLERGLGMGPSGPFIFCQRNTMSRVAIFVDAGYLYARGSEVICGSPQPRTALKLNRPDTVDKLRQTAREQAGDATLLRIYWYDGVPRQGPSQEQQDLADSNDVKLRLGVINSYGQQKGVDSLIVTDLVELARNRAITDAVVLSGDEDIRIGVLIAQSFGVRAHLIGIGPGRGSQSRSLLQESDTTVEWSEAETRALLTLKPTIGSHPDATDAAGPSEFDGDVEAALDQVVAEVLASIESKPTILVGAQIPWEYDSRLLASARRKIGRDLDWSEKTQLRDKFREQTNTAGDS